MIKNFTRRHLSNHWSLLKKLTGLTMLALLFPLLSFSQYTNALGGWNGGGTGNSRVADLYSGGGGGASDIRIGGTSLTNRVIVAGGGGGGGTNGGFEYGGKGGGTTGGDGNSAQLPYGIGHGGTQTAGGAAEMWAGITGTPGILGIGGNGGSGTPGGAGGGGYYGGGGGSWSGGGGGSSYASGICSSVVHTQGYQTGNGQVIISGLGFGTQTFDYTGGVQTFVVPSGVSSVTIDIKGGKGGGHF